MVDIIFTAGVDNFVTQKNILIEESPYFKAMFSGSYADVNEKCINIDLFEPQSIDRMVHYLNHNELKVGDAFEMIDLLRCCNYFQIDTLIKQLDKILLNLIDNATWFEIMEVALENNLKHLAQTSELYGLYEFEDMFDHIDVIKSFNTLTWYLKNPKLFVKDEFQVYKFGEVWIDTFEDNNEKIIEIIKLLDFQNLTSSDLERIAQSKSLEKTSRSLLDCLFYAKTLENSFAILNDEHLKEDFQNKFDNVTIDHLIEIIKNDKRKGPNFSPAMIMYTKERGIDFIHRVSKQSAELEPWLEVHARFPWVYSVNAWGAYKVVVTSGELGGRSDIFQRCVRVWDELLQKWDNHDIELPCTSDCAALVHKNILYLVGGIVSNHVVQSSGFAYDLKKRSWTTLPILPDKIQQPVTAICVHNNEIHLGISTTVYALRKIWEPVVVLKNVPRFFCSHGDYLYIARRYHKNLWRYSTKSKLLDDQFALFEHNVAGMCNLGSKLYAFTEDLDERSDCYLEQLIVNQLTAPKPEMMWSSKAELLKFHAMPGCFPIVHCNQNL